MTPNQELIPTSKPTLPTAIGEATLPALIADAGAEAGMRFLEFFAANIRNKNTREAYARAVARFCTWCEERGIALAAINPVIVSAYVEGLQTELSAPSVKQHLAGIKMLFDWLVNGGILPMNPAASVRGPKYVSKKGKTPVMDGPQAAKLLESIDTGKIVGLRDRALIGVMVYSFARIGAVLRMNVEDFFQDGTGRTMMLRLHEKGGKHHEVPVHHHALSANYCNHTFRATGITVYLCNGGTLEKAQEIAAHESPRTTKIYDHTGDTITLDEINRIDLSRSTNE